MKKVAIVTNAPAPYREATYERLSDIYDLTVIFLSRREANRFWNIEPPRYKHIFLTSRVKSFGEKTIYYNSNILPTLNQLNPDHLVICGHGTEYLKSLAWATLKRRKSSLFTDSNILAESDNGQIRKQIRRLSQPFFDNAICVGNKGREMLLGWGFTEKNIFISPLCVDNNSFLKFSKSFENRDFDILFSGQFIRRKSPLFFSDVVHNVSAKISRKLRVGIMGEGPMKKAAVEGLSDADVELHDFGHVSQQDLAKVYGNSKLLLFPSKSDPWGIVANEAMAAGCLVLTTEFAGSADDLIVNGQTGFVLPLTKAAWTEKCLELLGNNRDAKIITSNAKNWVKKWNFEVATNGIENAITNA